MRLAPFPEVATGSLMNKLRWGKFYWSDWADDPALALCSLAAQGLWMRLLCIAAQGTPYGHVTVNGQSPSVVDLARLLMRDDDRHRHRVRSIARLIAELEHNGVAHRGLCGCLISRRMERDGQLAKVRSEAVDKRLDRANLRPSRAQPAPGRRPVGARAAPDETTQPFENTQNYNTFVNTEAELESDKDPPVAPPKSKSRQRKQSKEDSAWTQIAKRGAN